MSMMFPELIIECTLRDGFENLKQRPEVLDSVFAELTKPYAARKYGASEIQKIKDLLTGQNNQEIFITHSQFPTQAQLPAISIQLGSDTESRRYSVLDDFDSDETSPITDLDELAELVRVPNLVPTNYDATSGKLTIPDSADLSQVAAGFIYEDGSGETFTIKAGISNTLGNKFVFLDKGLAPDISAPGEIRTFLNYTQHEVRTVVHDVQLTLGIHSTEPLLTKYLYILAKFILLSRKKDLIKRGFLVSSLSGTDFRRDQQYQGDLVFMRFLSVTGTVLDYWNSDEVDLIDSIVIDATPDCGCDED